MTKCPNCGADVEDGIQALFKRAAQASQGKNYQAAVEFYEQVLRADSYHFEAYYGLAASLFELGRYVEAMQVFQDALRLWPGASTLYQNIGIALKKLGREQEAIQHFEKALTMVDDDQLVNVNFRSQVKKAMQRELDELRPKKSGLKFWQKDSENK